MTLDEYYNKKKHIEETHPCPEGLGLWEQIDYFRNIIVGWQSELSPEDYKTVQEAERRWQDKMQSCDCPVLEED